MENYRELVKRFNAAKTDMPPPLRREVGVVMHKMKYPMAKILAKVPGTSLTERAKALRVSRQTMYVWMSEKFRPTKGQAKRISKATGVPVEHIIINGFEVIDEARRKARKAAKAMAERGDGAAEGSPDASPKRSRKAEAGSEPDAA